MSLKRRDLFTVLGDSTRCTFTHTTGTSPMVMAWDKIHHSPTGYEVRTKVYLELAATLAQRASDMTTTTTVAPTTLPTTVAPTTVPPTTVPPPTTLAP
ncbi:MAG: hypothetical protein ACKO61_03535 [Actinomycetota bacterium]